MAETSLGCIRLGHPKDIIGSFQCVAGKRMSFRTINFGEVSGDKSNQSHVAGHTISTIDYAI